MRRLLQLAVVSSLLAVSGPLLAQFEPAPEGKGPRLDKEFTQRYQVGVKINAGGGPCRGLIATIPVPQDWPEQQVRVDVEEISKSVRSVRYTKIGEGARQMMVSVPILPAGQQANALITYEITRYTLLPPADTTIFSVPKKLSLSDRRNLGQSPLIEARHGDIRTKVKEILATHQDASDWEQVEALYDWVRENITPKRGKLKGAVQTLRDGIGNEEDINSLFIALCRAHSVPARTVWIPDSSYVEFLMADDEGTNHWLPCRLLGDRAFGGIDCEKPVLQKGDNFKVSHRREPVRYVPEFVKGTGGRPRVDFVRLPLLK